VYSLRKFVRLAASGNPTIMILFHTEPLLITPLGERLRGISSRFVTRRAGRAFLGYMVQQRERLTGERGEMGARHVGERGYDGKYAMHMLRLGFQGRELLQTGAMTLPMRPPERDYLLSVRVGREPLDDVLSQAGQLEREVQDLIETAPVPEEADADRLDLWLVDTYTEAWGAREGSQPPAGQGSKSTLM
jgi:hypothetical protein